MSITARQSSTEIHAALNGALATLRASGSSVEAQAILDSAASEAARQYASIKANITTSEVYKARLMAAQYKAAAAAVASKLEPLAAKVTTTHREDLGRVFGTVGLSGDQATLTISRRDAGDRVADIMDEAALTALLSRADVSGDEVLARAVAQRSVEVGFASVFQRYLNDRPLLAAAGERLWTTANRSSDPVGALILGGLLNNLRPDHLRGATDWTIDQHAAMAGTE